MSHLCIDPLLKDRFFLGKLHLCRYASVGLNSSLISISVSPRWSGDEENEVEEEEEEIKWKRRTRLWKRRKGRMK